MGLFDKLFGKQPQSPAAEATAAHFQMLTGYTPAFTTRDGGLFEMELTRAAIGAFANHCSKLKPEVTGSAKPWVKTMFDSQPTLYMDTARWLKRIATITETTTTGLLIPEVADSMVVGLYPAYAGTPEVVEVDGEPWLRYTFATGKKVVVPLADVGMLTSYQLEDDLFGSGHRALAPTLDLLDLNRQGMSEAIEKSAVIRFIARLAQTLKPDAIRAERERFATDNLGPENRTGVMMFDAKYADVKEVQSKPYVIDAEQRKLIEDNVHSYFGTNPAILKNEYDEAGWDAFYEGKVEPFALALSLTVTNMLFTARERAHGNGVWFSANRLQYASNKTKVAVVKDLTDRGLMSNYAASDVFNLPRPPGPERWVIRGEYIDLANLPEHSVSDARGYLTPGKTEETEDAE